MRDLTLEAPTQATARFTSPRNCKIISVLSFYIGWFVIQQWKVNISAYYVSGIVLSARYIALKRRDECL